MIGRYGGGSAGIYLEHAILTPESPCGHAGVLAGSLIGTHLLVRPMWRRSSHLPMVIAALGFEIFTTAFKEI